MKINKTVLILGVLSVSLTGCTNIKENALYAEDRIEVIPANESNPYPDCKHAGGTRIADLSVDRSERVYLEGGVLCK